MKDTLNVKKPYSSSFFYYNDCSGESNEECDQGLEFAVIMNVIARMERTRKDHTSSRYNVFRSDRYFKHLLR